MTIDERLQEINRLQVEYCTLEDSKRIASTTTIHGGKIIAQLVEVVKVQQQRIERLEKMNPNMPHKIDKWTEVGDTGNYTKSQTFGDTTAFDD